MYIPSHNRLPRASAFSLQVTVPSSFLPSDFVKCFNIAEVGKTDSLGKCEFTFKVKPLIYIIIKNARIPLRLQKMVIDQP